MQRRQNEEQGIYSFCIYSRPVEYEEWSAWRKEEEKKRLEKEQAQEQA
jgi:NADP-dependent 3-hydroxy acid dehydrogenase YdfG